MATFPMFGINTRVHTSGDEHGCKEMLGMANKALFQFRQVVGGLNVPIYAMEHKFSDGSWMRLTTEHGRENIYLHRPLPVGKRGEEEESNIWLYLIGRDTEDTSDETKWVYFIFDMNIQLRRVRTDIRKHPVVENTAVIGDWQELTRNDTDTTASFDSGMLTSSASPILWMRGASSSDVTGQYPVTVNGAPLWEGTTTYQNTTVYTDDFIDPDGNQEFVTQSSDIDTTETYSKWPYVAALPSNALPPQQAACATPSTGPISFAEDRQQVSANDFFITYQRTWQGSEEWYDPTDTYDTDSTDTGTLTRSVYTAVGGTAWINLSVDAVLLGTLIGFSPTPNAQTYQKVIGEETFDFAQASTGDIITCAYAPSNFDEDDDFDPTKMILSYMQGGRYVSKVPPQIVKDGNRFVIPIPSVGKTYEVLSAVGGEVPRTFCEFGVCSL